MDRDSRSIEPRVVSQRLRSVQRLAIGRTASQDGRRGAPRLSYGATVPVSAGPELARPKRWEAPKWCTTCAFSMFGA
jgi:hypothetical protein